MKKEKGKAKKKDHFVNFRMSKNITPFLETQYSLCQVGILLRYPAFSLVFERRIGTVAYCAASYARSVEFDAQM